MGQGRKPALTPKKYPHLTELHLTGFPLQLKKEMMECAKDEGSSLTEFVKRVMREKLPQRLAELAPEEFRPAI